LRKSIIVGAVFGLVAPFLSILVEMIPPGPNDWAAAPLWPGAIAMIFLGFGNPPWFEVVAFFAVAVLLNGLIFALVGAFVGLIGVILFGQSQFIRPD
jgi:hypothetical protein